MRCRPGTPVAFSREHQPGSRICGAPLRAAPRAGHERASMPQVDELKAVLRREMTARRDALPAADRQQAAETIAARAFPVPLASGAIVSGFMPLKSEINPLPLMRKLAEAGARL